MIEAQIAEAKAALDKARRDFERQKALFDRKVVSEAQLDQAREAITVAEARVTSTERQKDVAAMPARTPEIDAGERAVDAAHAALEQAQTRLDEIRRRRARRRPHRGHLLRGGRGRLRRRAGAAAPSRRQAQGDLLRAGGGARLRSRLGATVSVACDGCAAGSRGDS